eukprot:6143953-Ditylum_brightwellii.AAC.1
MIGCSLVDPTGTIKVTQNLVKFVDDSSLLHINKDFATPTQALMKQVQYDVGLWGRYLCMTSSMRQWVTSNRIYIKYYLSIGLKQKCSHAL